MKLVVFILALVQILSCFAQIEICGNGTIWSDQVGLCILVSQSDVDLDGCVGVDDLLFHIANMGSGCEESVSASWECGDSIFYHANGYETVLVGGQCWFAENLATTFYTNGDDILQNVSYENWNEYDGVGKCAIYAEWSSAVDVDSVLSHLGRLYNWYAVNDDRGICPQGWSVPSTSDYLELQDFLGGQYIGSWKLKTEFDWPVGSNGTNEVGFNAKPGKYRTNGSPWQETDDWIDWENLNTGWWWLSDETVGSTHKAHSFFMSAIIMPPQVNHSTSTNKRLGCSIRCLKD